MLFVNWTDRKYVKLSVVCAPAYQRHKSSQPVAFS
jgi:hypothetical protein